uniref:Uncharacterized protein n=1 Tax=Timema poppense TaxID=170557 RepID=A0A7R9CT16_TIMPO|nr:unnamed protein product [Timema poppensis]
MNQEHGVRTMDLRIQSLYLGLYYPFGSKPLMHHSNEVYKQYMRSDIQNILHNTNTNQEVTFGGSLKIFCVVAEDCSMRKPFFKSVEIEEFRVLCGDLRDDNFPLHVGHVLPPLESACLHVIRRSGGKRIVGVRELCRYRFCYPCLWQLKLNWGELLVPNAGVPKPCATMPCSATGLGPGRHGFKENRCEYRKFDVPKTPCPMVVNPGQSKVVGQRQ